jgi:hypothetical protein
MWRKLESLHLKKSPESIFTLQAKFFDYKMSASDDISSYIQNINEMAMVLVDLGSPISETVILSKIICSLLPSYNNIVAAWSNVPEEQQNVDYLEEKLLRHEGLMHTQGDKDSMKMQLIKRSSHELNNMDTSC